MPRTMDSDSTVTMILDSQLRLCYIGQPERGGAAEGRVWLGDRNVGIGSLLALGIGLKLARLSLLVFSHHRFLR